MAEAKTFPRSITALQTSLPKHREGVSRDRGCSHNSIGHPQSLMCESFDFSPPRTGTIPQLIASRSAPIYLPHRLTKPVNPIVHGLSSHQSEDSILDEAGRSLPCGAEPATQGEGYLFGLGSSVLMPRRLRPWSGTIETIHKGFGVVRQ
jgi:hypothetical protein